MIGYLSLLQSFSRQSFFCLIQTQPWIYFSFHTVGCDFHWWLVEYEDFKRTNPSTDVLVSLSALEMLLLPWQPQSRAEESGLNDIETSSKVVQWLLTEGRAVGEWQERFSRCYGLAVWT